jgi:Zn-dependent M28 family amino/carboxypeptidase
VQAFGFDPTKPKHSAYAPPPPGAPFYTAYNIYAKKVGNEHAEETIMVLAHKDSQSWIDSPGAYDNCVGTIATLEIARVLANYRSERTILFLFCNEEHTPWTSIKAAENFSRRGVKLIGLFNLDGLGGKSDEDIAADRKTNVTLYTTPEGKRLADLMEKVNDFYHIGLLQKSCQRSCPGDDDGSFVKAGYSCSVANIGSFPYSDSQYHLEGDVPERVDIANVRMATQATLAAVLWLDQALSW